ncbi:MAG: hypothetical protein Q7T78_17155 [Rhodoferax sp.]|nr:hypothetical protein [Rhodoferax sp.]
MTHIEDRRNVLRSFIARQGGFAAVVAKFKLSQSQASYLSQLTAKDSTASFGEKSAKNWEARLGLPVDTLVRPFAKNSTASQTPNIEPSTAGAVPSLAETLAQLGRVIAASDKLTRAQIKPILDQLLETPEQAAELGRRLEATIALTPGPVNAPHPPLLGVETKDIIKKKIPT